MEENTNPPTDQPAQADQQTPPTVSVPATPAADESVSKPSSPPAAAAEPTTSESPSEPTVTASPTETPSAPPAAAQPSAGQKKILLVEDDDNLADVYITRFQAEDFDVYRVPNGEAALSAALQYKPDIILLDVMMPKVSGFDVLDILRNTPETATVKVVMLTALGQDTDQQRAKDLGVDDYLVKSQVVIADVVERVKAQLGLTTV